MYVQVEGKPKESETDLLFYHISNLIKVLEKRSYLLW